jgi:hypothetical protein
MFSRNFWRAATERAVKTFAQAFAAMLVGNGIGLLDVNWVRVASVAGLAAVLSLATSVGSAQVGDTTPSLVGERR